MKQTIFCVVFTLRIMSVGNERDFSVLIHLYLASFEKSQKKLICNRHKSQVNLFQAELLISFSFYILHLFTTVIVIFKINIELYTFGVCKLVVPCETCLSTIICLIRYTIWLLLILQQAEGFNKVCLFEALNCLFLSIYLKLVFIIQFFAQFHCTHIK